MFTSNKFLFPTDRPPSKMSISLNHNFNRNFKQLSLLHLLMLNSLILSLISQVSASTDLGTCVCDLTLGACDPHCCCDSDCSSLTSKSSFDCLNTRGSFGRQPSSDNGGSTRGCYAKSYVNAINEPSNTESADLSIVQDDLRNLLCVQRDNSASVGRYFGDSMSGSNIDIINTRSMEGITTYSNPGGSSMYLSNGALSWIGGSGYVVGQPILIQSSINTDSNNLLRLSSTGVLDIGGSQFGGEFKLRLPNSAGVCTDQSIPFLSTSIPPTKCLLKNIDLSSSSSSCKTSALDYSLFSAFGFQATHLYAGSGSSGSTVGAAGGLDVSSSSSSFHKYTVDGKSQTGVSCSSSSCLYAESEVGNPQLGEGCTLAGTTYSKPVYLDGVLVEVVSESYDGGYCNLIASNTAGKILGKSSSYSDGNSYTYTVDTGSGTTVVSSSSSSSSSSSLSNANDTTTTTTTVASGGSSTVSVTTCDCSDSVVGAHYTVYYDASTSALTNIKVTVQYADLKVTGTTATDCTSKFDIPFTTSLKFLPSTAVSTPSSVAPKSGNPGYNFGSPVLLQRCLTSSSSGVCTAFDVSASNSATTSINSGTYLVSSSSAVNAATSSFPSYYQEDYGSSSAPVVGISGGHSTPGGQCILTGSSASSTSQSFPTIQYEEVYDFINFGEDTVIGCTLSLDRQGVQDFCKGNLGTVKLLSPVLPSNDGTSGSSTTTYTLPFSHVGVWGSADRSNPQTSTTSASGNPDNTFIPITDITPATGVEPVTTDLNAGGGCLATSVVDIEFLYVNRGRADNPQSAIVMAQGKRTNSYITMPVVSNSDGYSSSSSSSSSSGSNGEKHTFTFEMRFHFVKKTDSSDLDLKVPERPGLPLYLPRDVFYPLQLFGNANRRSSTVTNFNGYNSILMSTMMISLIGYWMLGNVVGIDKEGK